MKAVALALILVCMCSSAWAVYGISVSDLDTPPTPPNPIRVWGRVTSTSPLKITDGTAEIELAGISAGLEDFLVITGDWDGSVLTVTGSATAYAGPANTEMIYIPAGSFLMGNNGSEPDGDPDELPQHSVYLSSYWIGKYEVTRGEYAQFMADSGYSNPAYWSADGWTWKVNNNRTEPDYWGPVQDWGSGSFAQTDNHPVVGVTYYEAEAFCTWTGCHLPTEAQWEKAARWTGTKSLAYPWGDTWFSDRCNWSDDPVTTGDKTAPVGTYEDGVSPNGCYDMAGNMWEWCRDWYDTDYYGTYPTDGWPDDPQGPPSGSYRVRRGGCWTYLDDYCRAGSRSYDYPDARCYYYGIRVAR